MALDEHIFSAQPITPTTLTSAFNLARVDITPNTVAAPHISHFISSIAGLGLIETPPVSKVTPLPTSAIGLSVDLPPLYSITIILAGSSLPLETLKNEPIPIFCICCSLKDLTFSLGKSLVIAFTFFSMILGVQ